MILSMDTTLYPLNCTVRVARRLLLPRLLAEHRPQPAKRLVDPTAPAADVDERAVRHAFGLDAVLDHAVQQREGHVGIALPAAPHVPRRRPVLVAEPLLRHGRYQRRVRPGAGRRRRSAPTPPSLAR